MQYPYLKSAAAPGAFLVQTLVLGVLVAIQACCAQNTPSTSSDQDRQVYPWSAALDAEEIVFVIDVQQSFNNGPLVMEKVLVEVAGSVWRLQRNQRYAVILSAEEVHWGSPQEPRRPPAVLPEGKLVRARGTATAQLYEQFWTQRLRPPLLSDVDPALVKAFELLGQPTGKSRAIVLLVTSEVDADLVERLYTANPVPVFVCYLQISGVCVPECEATLRQVAAHTHGSYSFMGWP